MQVNGDWRVLVVAIMLNQTSGKQLELVHERFFAKYPGPREAAVSDEEMMSTILRPLGFYNRRAKSIKKMSAQFYVGGWQEPDELHGVGKYGADSYNIFVRGIIPPDVQDKELRRYVEWVRKHLDEQVHSSSVEGVSSRERHVR